MSEHEGTHVAFQQGNGELAEDLVEGSLDDAELPGTSRQGSVVFAHDVEDARVPPDPEQAPSNVVPPFPDPKPIEPEPAPPRPDTEVDPASLGEKSEEETDNESADSFPASDPPSHWSGEDPQ